METYNEYYEDEASSEEDLEDVRREYESEFPTGPIIVDLFDADEFDDKPF